MRVSLAIEAQKDPVMRTRIVAIFSLASYATIRAGTVDLAMSGLKPEDDESN